MKEDDKWIRQMRKQLEDYSEPLPTGLWEEIEKDLNQPALQPKVVPLWKRWQAVGRCGCSTRVIDGCLDADDR